MIISNLYSNYVFINIFNLFNYYFSNKLFLIKSINIKQTLNNVIFIVIKYFYIKSFFTTLINKLNFTTKNETVNYNNCLKFLLTSNLFELNSKSSLILFFNLKIIYAKNFLKIQFILNKNYLKKSIYYHNISNYMITLLLFSINNANLLVNYICLELISTKNQNSFIYFLKSLLFFIITVVKSKKIIKIVGFRILIKGRFNGNSRSKLKQLRIGLLNLQSMKNFVDFSKRCFNTKFGVFGLKV